MADPLYCPILVGAPCLKPEVWAAFAQAVLSALAIYASVRLASRQERSAKLQKIDGCIALLEHGKIVLAGTDLHTSGESLPGSVRGLSKLLSAVTTNDAPDYRVFLVVREADVFVAAYVEEMSRPIRNLRSLRDAAELARTAVTEAHHVAFEVYTHMQDLSIATRLRLKWKFWRARSAR